MASNWSELFINNNGTKKASPILLIFIAFQALLLVVVLVTIIWFNNDKVPDDDFTRYKRIPELAVENLDNKIPDLKNYQIESIQKKVFQIVSENTDSVDTDNIKAVIRNDETHLHTFDGQSTYFNIILDIPEIEQSYRVIYSSNAVVDPEVSTFVLCLEDDEEIIYQDFDCKSSDDKSIKEKIVAAYLKLFNSEYEYFSAYISQDDASKIVISPSVTYDNDEATKAKYINEVKASIESLGMPSESYTYYVRTADDVNYRN